MYQDYMDPELIIAKHLSNNFIFSVEDTAKYFAELVCELKDNTTKVEYLFDLINALIEYDVEPVIEKWSEFLASMIETY